jgi:acyl-coenzyme A thioesterase 13
VADAAIPRGSLQAPRQIPERLVGVEAEEDLDPLHRFGFKMPVVKDKIAAWLQQTRGLSRTLGEVVVLAEAAGARVDLPIAPDLLNPGGFLHGGVLAALIDDAGTVAVVAADREGRPGVTTDLSVSYLAPVREGIVTAEARARKTGKTLAFAEVEVRRSDGVLVAIGRITKYLPGDAQPRLRDA